ncbi:uncharacterized protein LY79DRAFT_532697 [Colletotrichum navitas]|uniref:Uncharacterized protein n=1 Tax=Colletotrichum navitas TaxID=681940 RepID=A0AAD8QDB7_9PEZI|nr:uncharacterized protein LY79DRAFT_532697 [Colletotrichum navitas]KAK1600144.1 hypothetical protein LY79DRAFT_532697 [Colletotrichum navitas]
MGRKGKHQAGATLPQLRDPSFLLPSLPGRGGGVIEPLPCQTCSGTAASPEGHPRPRWAPVGGGKGEKLSAIRIPNYILKVTPDLPKRSSEPVADPMTGQSNTVILCQPPEGLLVCKSRKPPHAAIRVAHDLAVLSKRTQPKILILPQTEGPHPYPSDSLSPYIPPYATQSKVCPLWNEGRARQRAPAPRARPAGSSSFAAAASDWNHSPVEGGRVPWGIAKRLSWVMPGRMRGLGPFNMYIVYPESAMHRNACPPSRHFHQPPTTPALDLTQHSIPVVSRTLPGPREVKTDPDPPPRRTT